MENSSTESLLQNNDVHSFSEPHLAKVKHLNWQAIVKFETKIIKAIATWDIEKTTQANQIIFDTKNLTIEKVEVDGQVIDFRYGNPDEVLGTPLIIPLTEKANKVAIYYNTTPNSEALQWLSAEQTAGKTQPFLFTQSQAILARTWIPCQDSPGVRFTYQATVKVPSDVLAIMSAENPRALQPNGTYNFSMKQPIPSYLMALAVGNLNYHAFSERTGVYAEPSVLQKAAFEFEDTEKMVQAAESLYGKYDWEVYDMVILPPSFPFGGMENPRLTFATPTIIAGDKSLTALVAHELAHSWSGNLVTNANWNDFWLNEGFTVYFERRIMEEVYGKPYAEMLAQLGYQDLLQTLEDLQNKPNDTQLKLNLEQRNPDDGLTDIAYEKGYFFLRLLESTLGREVFDRFLKNYFQEFKFKSVTTELFVETLEKHFASNSNFKQLNIHQWIYEPGLPKNCPVPQSDKFNQVEQQIELWQQGNSAKNLKTNEFSTHEWLHFLRNLPENLSTNQLTELDNAFGFSQSGNAEILAAWFNHTIKHNYQPAQAVLDSFLLHVGRRKFLTPAYKAILKTENGLEKALAIYKRARPNYHAVSTETIDHLLNYNPQ